MTSENTTADLKEGRAWLQRAASVLSGGEDSAAVEFASAAAAIGSGFVALAHAEVSQVRSAILSLSDEPTLAEAAQQREERAAAEARSHDDEPKHAVDDGVIWVAADCNGPVHAAVSQRAAQLWADDNEGDYEGLSVTALAVDRG